MSWRCRQLAESLRPQIGVGAFGWVPLFVVVACSAPESPRDTTQDPVFAPTAPGQPGPGTTADPITPGTSGGSAGMGVSTVNPSAAGAPAPPIPGTSTAVPVDPTTIVADSSWGVCRLVGASQRAGVGGTDLGFSVLAPGIARGAAAAADQLIFLFGDTWAQPTDACWYPPERSDDLQATLPAERPRELVAGDPATGPASECRDLHYTIDDPTTRAWRPMRLFADAGERTADKLLDTGFLRTPVTGFSDGARTFSVFLRNEPVYCSSAADCPSDARCSLDDAETLALGVCRASLDWATADAAPTFCLRPSICADRSACIAPPRGVCMARAPFTLQSEAGSFSPDWYAQDPRRAIMKAVYFASAFWPERPEDYAVGHRFATNKFVNSVARTVAYFDPADPSRNDYRPGNHTLLMWGRPGFAANRGAHSALFLLYQPLAGLLDATGKIAWSPRFFAGYGADGNPRWSALESEAVPVYGAEVALVNGEPQLKADALDFELVNHGAMTYVEALQRWVLFYGGSVPAWMLVDPATGTRPETVHEQPLPGAIHMRTAAHPWGRATLASPAEEAWSAPEPVLTPADMTDFLTCERPGALPSIGCTIPRSTEELIANITEWATMVAPDDWRTLTNLCMLGNILFTYLSQLEGSDQSHLYGANIIDSWTEDVTDHLPDLAEDERAVELYWNVSTWSPYQVVLMKTQLRARVPRVE